ncbi:MAG: hypothetical protein R3C14_48590 [Caldilineaceae bacterium]
MFTNNTTTYVRLSGSALAIGGALTAIAAVLHPNEVAHPEAIFATLWLLVHSTFMVATYLVIFGTMAIYLHQAPHGSRFNAPGFVLSVIGLALFSGFFFFETFILPGLANQPETVEILFNGSLGLGALLSGVIFTVGFVLFGIAIVQSGCLSRWGGLLLIIAAPLTGFSDLLPEAIGHNGIVLLGLVWLWLGIGLISKQRALSGTLEIAPAR